MNVECPTSCPFVGASRGAGTFPAGQIRRIASAKPSGDAPEVDETKRNILKLLGVAALVGAGGGGLVGATLQFAQPPLVGLTSFPTVQLLDLDGSPLTATKVLAEFSYETSDVLTFNYPLRNEPNFLLNLAPPKGGPGGAQNVPGGVGPQGSIVGFSAICQHLGCPAPAISYYPPAACNKSVGGKAFYIHCSCHGSTYDVTKRASNLTGPAVLPLPQVTLEWKDPSKGGDDTIWALNVQGPPINGHLDTLLGGYGVGATSQLTKQLPVVLCAFP